MTNKLFTALLCLLGFLTACPSTPPAPTPTPSRLARLEIQPDAALLTKAGANSNFTVLAFDATGQRIATPSIVWSSSHPETIGIGTDGTATALKDVGSSLLTATADGVSSSGATVLVAEPANGALLVSDAQIRGVPEMLARQAVSSRPQIRVTLLNVPELEIGRVVIGTGSAKVLGQVVSSTPVNGGTTVILEVSPLTQLFNKLLVEESGVLPEGDFDPEFPYPETASTAQRLRPQATTPLLEKSVAVGPFKCKVSAEVNVVDSPIQLKPERKIEYDVKFDLAGNDLRLARVVTKGKITFQTSMALNLQLKGKAGAQCEYKAAAIKIPITGPLSVVLALEVPVGFGLNLETAYTWKTLLFGLDGKPTLHFKTGFEYTPQTGVESISDIKTEGELKPKIVTTAADGAKSNELEASLQFYGYAGLDVALLVEAKKLGLFKAVSGPKFEFKWSPEVDQASAPNFAAAYELKWQNKFGLGGDLKNFLSFFRGTVAPIVTPEVKDDLIIAKSPQGTLSSNAARVNLGTPVTLSVQYKPESTTFVGLYNIGKVMLYKALKNPDGTIQLKTVDGLAPITASEGQTLFEWTWRPGQTDLGQHEFVAFTEARIMDFTTLEVAANSKISLVVDQPCTTGSGFAMCVESGPHVGNSGGAAISNAGNSVGYIEVKVPGQTRPRKRAAIWDAQLNHQLLEPIASTTNAESAALAISPNGQIVAGWSTYLASPTSVPLERAFIYQQNQLERIPTENLFPTAHTSQANSVQDNGDVIGDALVVEPDGSLQAYGWAKIAGQLKSLGALGTGNSSQGAIRSFNKHNQIVGYKMATGPFGAFPIPMLWTQDATNNWQSAPLTHSAGNGAIAVHITDTGLIVGSTIQASGQPRATSWQGAVTRTLPSLGGLSHVFGANEHGDIVGYSTVSTSSKLRRATLIKRTGEIVDLNSLINPQLGWVLEQAQAINNNGEIVGWGKQYGVERMFFLRPN